MSLIAWRKLIAGLSKDAGSKDVYTTLSHMQGNIGVSGTPFFDSLTLNNLVVRTTNRIPFGSDKYNSSATLFQSYTTNDDDEKAIKGVGWGAQTFTTSSAHTITSVKLLLRRVGSPGTVTVSIRGVSIAEKPTLPDLVSGSTDGNTLTTDGAGEWREITFGAGVALDTSTKYAIVVRAISGDGSNNLRWRDDNSSPTYTDGWWLTNNNSGADLNWTNVLGTDMMFEMWGMTPEESSIWNEDSNFHSIDANGIERLYIHTDDVDDTPVDAATTDPISSNWAFDHEAAADPHTGYMLESLFDAKGDLLTATADDAPAKLSVGSNGEILIANSNISSGLEWISLVTYASELVIHEDGAVYI